MVRETNKKIAMERVERLFELAEGEFKMRPELSDRYVRLAWNIKTRYNLRLPAHLKRKFCRKCFSFWRPGVSCRVRVRSGRVVITCLKCGRIVRLAV
ncbi:MAG: ribonuclease P [Candidatus Hadarchaeota archaeon]